MYIPCAWTNKPQRLLAKAVLDGFEEIEYCALRADGGFNFSTHMYM